MYKVDLNCDLGEGAKLDSEIIPLISSANVACGFHAGDSEIMDATVELCKTSNVSVGAHPGYPDKENFGRTNLDVTPKQVYDYTLYQLGALSAIAKAKGVKLRHVKPHGAMYNMAAKSKELSDAVVDAVSDFDSSLILLALSGSQMIISAKEKGIKYASEVFADRAYEADGTLRSRSLDGAMIEDENEAIQRVVRMIKEGKVKAYTGEDVELEAHSVCVHGDGIKALEFVKALNKAFNDNDIRVVPLYQL
ncbi:MAG: 5-oxoprolinase subunit PxpA [Eubacterium sp.]